MDKLEEYKKRVRSGERLDRAAALDLADAPLEELCGAADELRAHFCGNAFDLCTIVNGKRGRCSEDCRYCAQSAHYRSAGAAAYPLLSPAALLERAKRDEAQGALRFSIVAAGKRLSDAEVRRVSAGIRAIRRETKLAVCVSLGLLTEAQFAQLKAAGASRAHCNLESSERFFPRICTTHTWRDKVETLQAARRAGLEVCSGGIVGLGETMADRVDMALAVRELGVKSVPVNLLNPIAGTPYADCRPLAAAEFRRVVAIFRFLLPDGAIRLAGGRGLLADKGERCFRGGANAAISGDMLTTAGYTLRSDRELLDKLGYEVKRENG